jgi:hypothetical protein
LQLTGRKQAQAALLARRRQKWLESVDAKKSAAAFGEEEDELRTAEADDDEHHAVAAMMMGDDGNESVGASTQRAWEETQSQCAGNEDDEQEQRDNLDAYPVREYHDDEARTTAVGARRHHHQQQQQDEELVLDAEEEEQHGQRAPPFQRDVNRRMLGVDARLTPVPLSSVEALCLHSDRSGSNPTIAAARNHHAVAASSTTLRLTAGVNGSTANGTAAKRSFVPAGSTAAAEAARSGRFAAAVGSTSNLFVDPNSPAAAPRPDSVLKHASQVSAINTATSAATSMADALRSRDAAIRVTATRTVLRDAMNKSAGGGGAASHPFSPTADLPFSSSDKRSPDSRTASSAAQQQQQEQEQHLFVERALPTFEQRFVSTRFGDHRKSAQQQQQQKHLLVNNNNGGDNNDNEEPEEEEDSAVARHKIASLEKDIQNTYDLYAKEMAEYRAAYEGLRKETTELWAGTGLVEVGNVPASVQVARDMYARLLQEQQEEDRVRAQMVGALGAIAAQADEERRFAAYAEQFMQAAGLAVEDLGGLLEQARSLLDEYSRFVLFANQQQQQQQHQQQRSSSAVAALGAEKAERFRTVRRALEIHVDEAVRRVADEEREAGARLRAHELTLEQLKEDVRAEERRLQAARVGGGARSGSSKLRR